MLGRNAKHGGIEPLALVKEEKNAGVTKATALSAC